MSYYPIIFLIFFLLLKRYIYIYIYIYIDVVFLVLVAEGCNDPICDSEYFHIPKTFLSYCYRFVTIMISTFRDYIDSNNMILFYNGQFTDLTHVSSSFNRASDQEQVNISDSKSGTIQL